MQLFLNLAESLDKNKKYSAFFINETTYSYDDFSRVISRIRRSLQSITQNKEKNIGLIINDDIETYSAILALWLEGKAYVPINPESPVDRNYKIIKQAEIKTIIDSSDKIIYPEFNIIEPRKIKEAEINIAPVNTSDNELAYIFFTSGTTGEPKGVPITRANLSGFIDAFWKLGFEIDNNDRVLQMFELTFDLSVMSFLVPLLKGSCVYTIPKDKIKYNYIFELLDEHNLTVALMVPSILHYLRPYFDEIHAPSMRYSLFCGEALPLDVTEEWSQCLPNAEISNVYGPTENTIFCTTYKYNRKGKNKEHNGILCIGKSMHGVETIIVDDLNNKLPFGNKGELCLAGELLTPGYWKNDGKNKEAFFNIEINGKHKRFYKTGDLCVEDDDGDIMYLGRIDFQTKIQGFRVELSEIEFYVKDFLGKINTVAVPITNNIGNTEIGLIFESDEFETNKLLEYLKTKLPAYMIPNRLKFVKSFPLNINGKIDRKMLQESFNNPVIQVGQRAISKHTITQDKINDFAKLTGDYNPIHFDDNYAANTIFKRRIAHGPYVITLITTMFANKLPGPGSVYLSHDIKYVFPVYIGDVITASVEIIDILPKGHILVKTICTNQDNVTVIEGIARLKKY